METEALVVPTSISPSTTSNQTDIQSTSSFSPCADINLFFTLFIPTLSIFTTIGNTMIITAFIKLPTLTSEKPSELLILNLSCVDLLTGLIVLPVQSLVYICPGYWPLGEIGCRLQAISLQTNIYASLFTLICISIDRLLLVTKEYPRYLKIASLSRIRVTIVACWMIAFSAAMLEQGLWNIAKTLDDTAAEIDFDKTCLTPPRRLQSYTLVMFLTVYFMPVMLVCGICMVFLFMLCQRLQKNKQNNHQQHPSVNHLQVPSANHQVGVRFVVPLPLPQVPSNRRYIKSAVSLIAVVTAMAICMLPYCFYVITIELFCPTCNDPKILFSLLLLQFCNACLDPILYGMTQKKITGFYKSCFTRNVIRPL